MSDTPFRSFVMPALSPPAPKLGAPQRQVDPFENTAMPMGSTVESEDSIDLRIKRTFRVFDQMIRDIISGDCPGLVVSGAGGVGKTFLAEAALRSAAAEGLIKLDQTNTTISAVELYKLLYHNSAKGQVVMIDDCDTFWADLESLGVLKNALDSKDQRIVHWPKNSWVLNNDGIPNEFEYQGTCIFITNLDVQAMIDKGTKFSKHWFAFLSRVTYLDMGIHTKREVLVRIKQVLTETDFLAKHKLTEKQGKEMVDWISANILQIRALSIRTCLELGRFMRSDADWQDRAEVTLFRRS